MSVAWVIGSSTLALFTFLAAVRACLQVEVKKSLKVYIGPSWPNFIFLSNPNLCTVKKKSHVRTFTCVARACEHEGAQILWVHPWYPFQNHTNFCKDLTLLTEIWWVISCVHIYRRCAHARAWEHAGTFLINSGDQYSHLLKFSWRSDFIWLRYWGVIPGNTFGVRRT